MRGINLPIYDQNAVGLGICCKNLQIFHSLFSSIGLQLAHWLGSLFPVPSLLVPPPSNCLDIVPGSVVANGAFAKSTWNSLIEAEMEGDWGVGIDFTVLALMAPFPLALRGDAVFPVTIFVRLCMATMMVGLSEEYRLVSWSRHCLSRRCVKFRKGWARGAKESIRENRWLQALLRAVRVMLGNKKEAAVILRAFEHGAVWVLGSNREKSSSTFGYEMSWFCAHKNLSCNVCFFFIRAKLLYWESFVARLHYVHMWTVISFGHIIATFPIPAMASEDLDKATSRVRVYEQHSICWRSRYISVNLLISIALVMQPIAVALISAGHNCIWLFAAEWTAQTCLYRSPLLRCVLNLTSNFCVACRETVYRPAGCWCSLRFTFQAVSPPWLKHYKL